MSAESTKSGTNSSPALGVVAISYNEEQDLPGFLEHLLPWVDEIVIVDDGSTDRTAEIAACAGEKVNFIISPREQGEFYSHQRNKGIAVASSDWLLHMDIDERVSPSLAAEILRATQDTTKDAYRYRRLNYFMHRPMRGGGWQAWNLVHLARRPVFHFEGMFHEDCVVDTSTKRIGQLREKMLHFNENNFVKRLRKSDIYLQEVTEHIRANNKAIKLPHILWRPLREFIKKYIFNKGFLDGVPGLISAMHASTAIFRAYALVWDEQNRVERGDLEKAFRAEWKESGMLDSNLE